MNSNSLIHHKEIPVVMIIYSWKENNDFHSLKLSNSVEIRAKEDLAC